MLSGFEIVILGRPCLLESITIMGNVISARVIFDGNNIFYIPTQQGSGRTKCEAAVVEPRAFMLSSEFGIVSKPGGVIHVSPACFAWRLHVIYTLTPAAFNMLRYLLTHINEPVLQHWTN